MDKEFTVKISCGDVYINDKFIAQCCWDAESIGCAVTNYLNGNIDDTEE